VKQLILKNNVNCIPICAQIPADLLTPVMAFLKITEKSEYSFLLESIMDGEHVARYSFIGSGQLARMACVAADLPTGHSTFQILSR
jgi:anthranilate synthase component 1